jgi:glyoxylase-like metal-dependent hydrolase (beta-lactamase superfamily II)
MATIILIKLPLVNVYLVRGERWIVVDSGAPGDASAILRAAAKHGIAPKDIALILLTHGHVDHFGGAAALREASGAPIAVHTADLPYLQSGRNPDTLNASDLEGRMLRPFLPWATASLKPDIVFEGEFDLQPYGLDARTLDTPGHSPGHVALALPAGGLIAGDLLRGGHLGGALFGKQPKLPFYYSNAEQLNASLARVSELPLNTIYVGHGGPFDAAAMRAEFSSGRLALALPQGTHSR